MKVIRKIWIGDSLKGADTMSWEVGQTVLLGREGKAIVDSITKDEDGFHIHIKQDNKVMPWKSSTKVAGWEHDISF